MCNVFLSQGLNVKPKGTAMSSQITHSLTWKYLRYFNYIVTLLLHFIILYYAWKKTFRLSSMLHVSAKMKKWLILRSKRERVRRVQMSQQCVRVCVCVC